LRRTALRWVVARWTGLLAARAGAGVPAAGAGGLTVVVTVAAGLGAGRTTVAAFGAVFTGAGSGCGACDVVGAASGLAGCWAPAGAAAVARQAATTIVTQRKCVPAPISTTRTLAESTVLPASRWCNHSPTHSGG
jgi:hypothetical protein